MKSKNRLLILLIPLLAFLGFSIGVYAEDTITPNSTETITPQTQIEDIKNHDESTNNQVCDEKNDRPKSTDNSTNTEQKNIDTDDIIPSDTNTSGKSRVIPQKDTEKTTTKSDKQNTPTINEEIATSNEQSKENSEKVNKNEPSNYTVEFTHKNLQYVLKGNESVKLSKILDKVKIEGTNVENVECSNENLFSASKQNGEWIITSHKAFSSTESLKVTIDGKIYDITVTDEATSGYVGDSTTILWNLDNGNLLQVYTGYVSSPQTMPNSTDDAAAGVLFTGLDVSKVTRIQLYGYLGTIGDYAFYGFNNLVKVSWDTNQITNIGEGAFKDCISLMNISIHSSVTSIGDLAFDGCTGLASINIPSSVTRIGTSVFSGCTGLTSITIPDSVTYIGNYAFDNCNSLTSINIPSAVTSIGDWAFYNCDGLTSITIPDSVTYIGKWAFSSCSGATSITFPNSIMSIAMNAFSYCSSVSNLVIPTSVISIGQDAFYGLASGANIWYNHAESMKSKAKDSLTNKCYDGSIEKSFDSSANIYFKCGDQLWYTIKNNVATISKGKESAGSAMWDYAYSGTHPNFKCTSPFSSGNSTEGNTITSVNIYDATTIGAAAFFRCDNLTTVNIVDSVTTISPQAFNINSNLQTVFIPSTVTSMGDSAFQNNNASFYCCNAISIDDLSGKCSGGLGNVFSTSVGQSFYFRCGTNLWYMLSTTGGGTAYIVAYPSNAADKTMTNYSSSNSPFYALRSTLTGVNLGPATTVGDYAFIGCTGITTVTIPNTVTSLGTGAFQGSALSSVNFQANSQLTYLGPGAFMGTALTNVSNLPSSITTIGFYAFKDCTSLTRVVIPPNATINYDVFNGCSNLTDVIFQGTGARPQSNAFRGMKSTAHIYWPDTSDASLQTACGGNIADKFAVSAVHNSGNNAYVFYFKCGPSLWYKIQDRTVTVSKEIETGTGLLMYDTWNSSDALSPFNYYKNFFESVVISSDVANISKYAFYNCTGLTTITIPENITTIGTSAFKSLACSQSPASVVDVYYTIGNQNTFSSLCDTSIANCFDYDIGSSDNLLFHFTQAITYVDSGTTLTDLTPTTYVTNSDATVTLPTRSLENQEFQGWCLNSNLSDEPINSFTADNTQFGDRTFYAKWALATHAIIYYCQGGTILNPSATSYVPESGETITLDKPFLDGYAFCGWYPSVTLTDQDVIGGLDGEKVVDTYNGDATLTFTVGSNDQDVSFYAKWYERQDVPYWNGSENCILLSTEPYEIIKKCETTLGTPGETTWYVLTEDVEYPWEYHGKRLTVLGDVRIVLSDNHTLFSSGISVDTPNSLTIYSQQSDAEYDRPFTTSSADQKEMKLLTDQYCIIDGKRYYYYNASYEGPGTDYYYNLETNKAFSCNGNNETGVVFEPALSKLDMLAIPKNDFVEGEDYTDNNGDTYTWNAGSFVGVDGEYKFYQEDSSENGYRYYQGPYDNIAARLNEDNTYVKCFIGCLFDSDNHLYYLNHDDSFENVTYDDQDYYGIAATGHYAYSPAQPNKKYYYDSCTRDEDYNYSYTFRWSGENDETETLVLMPLDEYTELIGYGYTYCYVDSNGNRYYPNEEYGCYADHTGSERWYQVIGVFAANGYDYANYHPITQYFTHTQFEKATSQGKLQCLEYSLNYPGSVAIGSSAPDISSGNITICGGEIDLENANDNHLYIGSSSKTDGSENNVTTGDIKIYGGQIHAEDGIIGSGENAQGGIIEIHGGQIYAMGIGSVNDFDSQNDTTNLSISWTNKTDKIVLTNGRRISDFSVDNQRKFVLDGECMINSNSTINSKNSLPDNRDDNYTISIYPYYDVSYTLVIPATATLPTKFSSCKLGSYNTDSLTISSDPDDTPTDSGGAVYPYNLAVIITKNHFTQIQGKGGGNTTLHYSLKDCSSDYSAVNKCIIIANKNDAVNYAGGCVSKIGGNSNIKACVNDTDELDTLSPGIYTSTVDFTVGLCTVAPYPYSTEWIFNSD